VWFITYFTSSRRFDQFEKLTVAFALEPGLFLNYWSHLLFSFFSCIFALGTLSFLLFLLADPPLSLPTAGTACARRETGWHWCVVLEPAMEDNRVLSGPDKGGARRSSFSWLGWRSRKKALALLGFAGGAVVRFSPLVGFQQEPELEPLTEPSQTGTKLVWFLFYHYDKAWKTCLKFFFKKNHRAASLPRRVRTPFWSEWVYQVCTIRITFCICWAF